MLENIINYFIQNWAILTLIISAFFSTFLAQELAEIILFPLTVLCLVFKWIFSLFKKPLKNLNSAKAEQNRYLSR